MSKKGHEMASRNVFKVLGVANAQERLVNAQLVVKIDAVCELLSETDHPRIVFARRYAQCCF